MKRRDLSITEKQRILGEFDKLPKLPQREAAFRLNISQASLSRLLKNRSTIEGQQKSDRKRRRFGKDPVVETAVIRWITNAKEKNAPLSGPLVKEKAEEFALKLGKEDFKATDGWFSRLKKREGLQQKILHGDGQSGDFTSTQKWLQTEWPKIREVYSDEDIWNANESGIFYRALPDSTLTFNRDFKKGSKRTKERFTALFCCSMSGEKKRILVIGRFKKPRCFKGISLPVDYKANNSGLMTSDLFTEWLTEWNTKFRRQNKSILLLCDKCSAHQKDLNLRNIKIAFLPSNTTSIIQPCDQGVIQVVKANYRREMCKIILRQIDTSDSSAHEIAKKFNLLDSVVLMNNAWENIDPITIRNCWCKSGLIVGPHEKPVMFVTPPTFSDGREMPNEIWTAWLSVDDNLQVTSLQTDEEIVKDVRFSIKNSDLIVLETDPEDPDELEDEETLPTVGEMINAMDTLRKGLLSRNFNDFHLLRKFEQSVNQLVDRELTQQTIDKFFASTYSV